jgi:integrase/recombinase XerD
VGDYDAANRLLLIRESKWGKDRVVPVSQVAAAFVEKQIAGRRKEEPMFGSRRFRLSQTRIRKVFKRRLKESGIDKPGATLHSIRHATATHLLLNGAPIRYVQELLGHESIETTVRYTHVLTENLKRIYRQFHPRENALYKEVTKEYVDRLAEFKAELMRVRGENRKEKTVERKRKWEEKRLRKGG